MSLVILRKIYNSDILDKVIELELNFFLHGPLLQYIVCLY
ncbi:hypothetical protein SLEP1_g25401 [Rubroshorea leprosula]|uniref:Uncharacterized protein n=1 Tax=Rubroshorea leprosula TaxID=152421 RepID=A0AAV5JT97_9ROSI|nr:hypothetical protein SLEP1_g25401 [Rubroshorea leprosula]